mmetsp:Transcript_35393/g.57779  ORF Transcript_35393/g.57779 Transcript_35393/m.57779 type:complete len:108 (-) Transcript_35393:462-785(-)
MGLVQKYARRGPTHHPQRLINPPETVLAMLKIPKFFTGGAVDHYFLRVGLVPRPPPLPPPEGEGSSPDRIASFWEAKMYMQAGNPTGIRASTKKVSHSLIWRVFFLL